MKTILMVKTKLVAYNPLHWRDKSIIFFLNKYFAG